MVVSGTIAGRVPGWALSGSGYGDGSGSGDGSGLDVSWAKRDQEARDNPAEPPF